MSGSKRILLTLSVILLLTAISYLTLDVPASNAPSRALYTSEYLIGFSTPLIAAGLILMVGIHFVLRKKKRVIRKVI